jgi:hypothetical protein
MSQKIPTLKLHENPFSGSEVVTEARKTDMANPIIY